MNYNYPLYYKDVFVKFRIKGSNIIKTKKMWLAVNEYGDYIWTESSNNTIVWKDDLIEIINWWNTSTQPI